MVNILRPPEICGDGRCTENETCGSCPADCGRCNVEFGLAGLMTGAVELSLSGLVAVFVIAMVFILLIFAPRKKEHR
jgi:hypothetical protein